MPAKLHLLYGQDARRQTARLMAEMESIRGIGRTLWLAPSRLAAEEVLRWLVSRGRLRLVPNIVSLPGLVHSLRRMPRLSQQRLLMDQLVEERSRRGECQYFRRVLNTRGFGDAALRFVEELTALGLSPADCQQSSGNLRSDKWRACVQLYQAWVATLARPASGLPLAMQHVRTVFVDGFASFSRGERQVLQQLATKVDHLWITLPWYDDREANATPDRTRQELLRLFGRAETALQPMPQRSKRKATDDRRPAGLQHLQHHLFQRGIRPATDATGVQVIAAPGMLGEARMVARTIRTALNDGIAPTSIVVAVRDLDAQAELLGDVFAEYGIPTHLAGDETLATIPIIAVLLRAANLEEQRWPFADVTALLRSTYFQPAWPEYTPAMAQHAETLLRLLGEPRYRDAYLRAVDIWADSPPEGLEDEQAEESRRQRKTKLAKDCRPFLRRFFASWDALPTQATASEFAAWLKQFADDLGIAVAALRHPRDQQALALFWEALAEWETPPMKRTAFFRGLATIANAEALPRSSAGCNAVRVVPAHEACHLHCEHLVLMGLGEGSFPRLSAPDSLIDDADRTILRQAGLSYADPSMRLADEQLLFLRLLATPQQRLTLSYAAVDDKGQPLLAGTFLRAVQEAFTPDALPVLRQRMLIEGYLHHQPLSLAEARVQYAAQAQAHASVPWATSGLPNVIGEQLGLAKHIAEARFHTREHNEFDGLLTLDVARSEVQARFGPDRVYSPTALENYVLCPFRFFLEQVLRLEELEEPSDDVEQTRRGSAYHRALARMHTQLREQPEFTHTPLPDSVDRDLNQALTRAIDEYIERSPSPSSKVLWQLERQRLLRTVPKYRTHWEGYLAPWRKENVRLAPQWLEADFGLPADPRTSVTIPPALIIDIQGVRVQVGGRIDRVDVAELDDGLGFWIIDYKTGRSDYYTAKGVQNFEKLQLPLYALAVERVLATDRRARPLGLAYWLVTDNGVKSVLPGSGKKALAWLNDAAQWETFRSQLEQWVTQIVAHVRDGQFPLAPRSDHCTDFCPYHRVCRINQSRHVGKTWALEPPNASSEESA